MMDYNSGLKAFELSGFKRLAYFLIGVGLVSYGTYDFIHLMKLNENGTKVDAQIVDADYRFSILAKHNNYHPRVQFQSKNSELIERTAISSGYRNRDRINEMGSMVLIVYNPNDLHEIYVAKDLQAVRNWTDGWTIAFGFGFLIPFLLSFQVGKSPELLDKVISELKKRGKL